MASGIYKITDKRNNKIYIGRAVDLDNRKWRHFCYTHPEDYALSSIQSEINMDIHKAMMESKNANDFIFEIIEYCDVNELDKKEQYYIKYYDCKVPKGYNKTDGGNTFPHLQGENHYNHKITQQEADLIKQLLKERKSVNEIIQQIPNATLGIISHINNGRSWVDSNLQYPICKLSGLIKFDDETVMAIRREKENGKTITELAQKYNTGSSTITSICNGTTHKDLPILKTTIRNRDTFTEQDVNYFREQYYIYNIPKKLLYEQSEFTDKITFSGFRNMIDGYTYKQYKMYPKKDTQNQTKNSIVKKRDINNLIERNNKIRKLAEQGIQKREIAKIIGCSERTVYRAINKENGFE